jgi:hypothetical protein
MCQAGTFNAFVLEPTGHEEKMVPGSKGGARENFADFKHEASFSRTTRIFDEED